MVQALLAMPNASDFIRKAITRSLEEPCPVCIGTGVVATGFRSQLERSRGTRAASLQLLRHRIPASAPTSRRGSRAPTASLGARGQARRFLCAPCSSARPL